MALAALLACATVACAKPSAVGAASPAPSSAAHAASSARVLSSSSGTRLAFCTSPGLSVDIRLDSIVAPGTPVAMGTAVLAAGASNVGTHRDADEAIYFLTSGGRAFVAADTVAVEPGVMLWVPRGVPHGFWSTADRPIHFVWVNVPQSLAQRFRANGVAPGTACPARAP